MNIKPGVIMSGLQLEMRPAIRDADWIWKELGQELVITSALDGTHSAGSYHYYGYAVDLRSRYFSDQESQQAANKLSALLGKEYTVINEATHIHVQFNAAKWRQ